MRTALAGLMLALSLVALPQIIADPEGFVTTAYLLASAAMIPMTGKLGDERGRATHAPKTVVRPLAARGGTR